jgi:hypothetical protein
VEIVFFLLNFATVLITINPGSDETYPDSKAEISTKLVAPKLGLFFQRCDEKVDKFDMSEIKFLKHLD